MALGLYDMGSSNGDRHTSSAQLEAFILIQRDMVIIEARLDENVGGLEVMDKSGAFVAVDPEPGTLVVNLGDVATAWSNGRLRNVKHRVQSKEATLRISIATFLLGPKKAEVDTPSEFVDAQNPRLYAPFTIEDYRKLRASTKSHAGKALELVRIQS
ncbi:2-oxoglutarate-dependent dioxygenase DAO [Jatropha curcas]|uniref:2-oxoglutarate-dependent dioxygenase DAO n=1 Tax=Jatropha curcas TaxID=180498 RepID=UPI0018958849|nr:2-oxoglutarate-dependent dioxygenase DAO [Jatropha curcas]